MIISTNDLTGADGIVFSGDVRDDEITAGANAKAPLMRGFFWLEFIEKALTNCGHARKKDEHAPAARNPDTTNLASSQVNAAKQ